MAYKILYFDEALDNVKESKKWYKERIAECVCIFN
jgi:hypothetical protein